MQFHSCFHPFPFPIFQVANFFFFSFKIARVLVETNWRQRQQPKQQPRIPTTISLAGNLDSKNPTCKSASWKETGWKQDALLSCSWRTCVETSPQPLKNSNTLTRYVTHPLLSDLRRDMTPKPGCLRELQWRRKVGTVPFLTTRAPSLPISLIAQGGWQDLKGIRRTGQVQQGLTVLSHPVRCGQHWVLEEHSSLPAWIRRICA